METFSKEEMFKQIAAWEDGAKVEEVLALRYAQSSRLLQETEALVRILALLVEHRYIMTGRIDVQPKVGCRKSGNTTACRNGWNNC
ncbi:hypothetical protein [Exiguobacterium antarcticum]|uniref:hypothetical protein n=1 Tax=Exiguobacterium antarcticum TaxID=132920 RepID=UPI000300894E|nr:hypothetical protein [Exiguobacterium antarcticum]